MEWFFYVEYFGSDWKLFVILLYYCAVYQAVSVTGLLKGGGQPIIPPLPPLNRTVNNLGVPLFQSTKL